MYINPFIAGVLFVVLVELIGLLLTAATLKSKEDNDGKKK